MTVAPVDGRLAPEAGPKVVMDHLERASVHLRYEIAASVTRKRAPLLFYRLAEPTLADAILDRLVHHSHRIELTGESLRKNTPDKKSRKA